jgi:hypothetical protein
VTALPFLFVRVIWDAHVIKVPFRMYGVNVKELHLGLDPNHPFGRKGLALEQAWQQLAPPNCRGMLILDGDTLIDPQDYALMCEAIEQAPDAVHVAPARIWPSSKPELRGWSWAHWSKHPTQELETEGIEFFSFNFTYLPAGLMQDAIKGGLSTWKFPLVDSRMARTARLKRYPVHVVAGARAMHLNY